MQNFGIAYLGIFSNLLFMVVPLLSHDDVELEQGKLDQMYMPLFLMGIPLFLIGIPLFLMGIPLFLKHSTLPCLFAWEMISSHCQSAGLQHIINEHTFTYNL